MIIRYFKMPAILLLFVSFSFISIPTKEIELELIPYYKDYVNLIESVCNNSKFVYPNKIKMSVVESLPGNAIGRCFRTPLYARIDLDKTYWTTSSEDRKFALINHELSHCLIWKNHVNDPKHYMAPSDGPIIRKSQVILQVIQDANELCQKYKEIKNGK